LILLLAAGVLFCFFMPRANRNASSFGSFMNISPGWAAGWFFIPFANLWMPYQAMREIWQGSDPDRAFPRRPRPVSGLIKWWWGMYLAHNIGGWMVALASKGASRRRTSSTHPPSTWSTRCCRSSPRCWPLPPSAASRAARTNATSVPLRLALPVSA
jgi:hypothetical protein